jgi:hypothetical protein
MSLFCKGHGCEAVQGPCKHEKMMLGVIIVGGLAALAHWGMNLF